MVFTVNGTQDNLLPAWVVSTVLSMCYGVLMSIFKGFVKNDAMLSSFNKLLTM